jgi:hypothetical protein
MRIVVQRLARGTEHCIHGMLVVGVAIHAQHGCDGFELAGTPAERHLTDDIFSQFHHDGPLSITLHRNTLWICYRLGICYQLGNIDTLMVVKDGLSIEYRPDYQR